MRHMTAAAALQVLVSDFGHQLGPQRLPRQALALAPAALPARHALSGLTACGAMLRPVLPRMMGKRVLPIRRQVFGELPALLLRKARANADVLQRARIVEKAE